MSASQRSAPLTALNSIPPSLLSIAVDPQLDPLVQAAKKRGVYILEERTDTVPVAYAQQLLQPSTSITEDQWKQWAAESRIDCFELQWGKHVIVMLKTDIEAFGGMEADESPTDFVLRLFGHEPDDMQDDTAITDDQLENRKRYAQMRTSQKAQLLADWIPPQFAPLQRMNADMAPSIQHGDKCDPIAFQAPASAKSRRNHFSESQQLQQVESATDPYTPCRSPSPQVRRKLRKRPVFQPWTRGN